MDKSIIQIMESIKALSDKSLIETLKLYEVNNEGTTTATTAAATTVTAAVEQQLQQHTKEELLNKFQQKVFQETYNWVQKLDIVNPLVEELNCTVDQLPDVFKQDLGSTLSRLSVVLIEKIFRCLKLGADDEPEITRDEKVIRIEEELLLQGVFKLLYKLSDNVLKLYCVDLSVEYCPDKQKLANSIMNVMYDLVVDDDNQQQQQPQPQPQPTTNGNSSTTTTNKSESESPAAAAAVSNGNGNGNHIKEEESKGSSTTSSADTTIKQESTTKATTKASTKAAAASTPTTITTEETVKKPTRRTTKKPAAAAPTTTTTKKTINNSTTKLDTPESDDSSEDESEEEQQPKTSTIQRRPTAARRDTVKVATKEENSNGSDSSTTLGKRVRKAVEPYSAPVTISSPSKPNAKPAAAASNNNGKKSIKQQVSDSSSEEGEEGDESGKEDEGSDDEDDNNSNNSTNTTTNGDGEEVPFFGYVGAKYISPPISMIKPGYTADDLRNLYNLPDLHEYCKVHNIPKNGNKSKIIKNILLHLEGKPIPTGKKKSKRS